MGLYYSETHYNLERCLDGLPFFAIAVENLICELAIAKHKNSLEKTWVEETVATENRARSLNGVDTRLFSQ
ncbi:MAG: hypothetical protein AAGG02_15805 [Cyanobacteria bacterium P01_H01_bin.15]